MKYLVMETKLSYCVVLSEDGRFIKSANMGYKVGETVEEIFPMSDNVSSVKSGNNSVVRFVTVAATFAASLLLVLSILFYQNQSVYGNVYFEVNPSVTIELNRKNTVVGLIGTNQDGEKLIEGYKYKNKNVYDVTRYLIDKSIERNYLDGDKNVSLSIQSKDNEWYKKLGVELRENIVSEYTNTGISVTIDKYTDVPSETSASEESSSSEEISKKESSDIISETPPDSKNEISSKQDISAVETKPEKSSSIPESSSESKTSSDSSTQESTISLDQAQQIALNHSGESSANVKFSKSKLNKNKYEIEFYTDSSEYEYDIDAKTGSILKVEKDYKVSSESSSSTKLITREQAIQIALSDAGVSRSQITDLDVDADDDKYEIEFEVDDIDYQYEIDSSNGNIIKSKKG